MAEKHDVFKCNVCGHIIEVIHAGSGDLVCCGEKMEKMAVKTEDQGQEKHVPVVEPQEDGSVLIKVGSVEHPMEDEHYIEWIQAVMKDKVVRKFLKPGDKPQMVLPPCPEGMCDRTGMVVREYCNKHGLWKKQ